MKSSLSFIRDARFPMMIVSVFAGVLFVTMAVNASTTISTSITTGGSVFASSTAAITGATTIYGNLMVNGMATTTASTGAIATEGNLTVLGTASTTALKVGATANTITDASVGYCTIATGVTVVASSTAIANCTASIPLSSSDKIFVMATGSVPVNMVVAAASTTSTTNVQIRFLNVGLTDGVSPAVTALGVQVLNIWAVR